MNSDTIVAEARRMTGLYDFDSESFREGLDIVADGLVRSSALTEAGRQTIAGIAVNLLANRLRIADYARTHAEILDHGIVRPGVILGVPRTGTTMLSHALALDPEHRSLLHWEAFDSVPPATQDTLLTDPRCIAMREADTSALESPSEIHVLRADLPTECIISQAHDFKSILWHGIAENPAYTRWLLTCDMRSAYAFHKLQLQVLQSRTVKRWVLKAPAHSLSIPTLRDTYPDARIVWTHRDPYTAIASACSFIAASRQPFGKVDEKKIGPEFLDLFVQHLARAMAFDATNPGAVYRLDYAGLVRDPFSEIEKLYDWLGDPFGGTFADRLRAWLEQNRKGKHGAHTYDLARFGLSKEMLRTRFGPYIERYDVTLDNGQTLRTS